jgi:hypothetical protein
MNLNDVVLVRRGTKGNAYGNVVSKVVVKEISPSGRYFQAMDARAVENNRAPDIYDFGWFSEDDIVEVISEG